jgi:hypothetical protein
VRSLDELLRHVQLAWESERRLDPAASGTAWMVRVVLSGPCPLWAELRSEEDREHVASELAELLGALEVTVSADGLYPLVSLREHAARVDVLGEALRLCTAVQRGDVSLGIPAADLACVGADDPATVDRYVRDLLAGADGELAARMLKQAGE